MTRGSSSPALDRGRRVTTQVAAVRVIGGPEGDHDVGCLALGGEEPQVAEPSVDVRVGLPLPLPRGPADAAVLGGARVVDDRLVGGVQLGVSHPQVLAAVVRAVPVDVVAEPGVAVRESEQQAVQEEGALVASCAGAARGVSARVAVPAVGGDEVMISEVVEVGVLAAVGADDRQATREEIDHVVAVAPLRRDALRRAVRLPPLVVQLAEALAGSAAFRTTPGAAGTLWARWDMGRVAVEAPASVVPGAPTAALHLLVAFIDRARRLGHVRLLRSRPRPGSVTADAGAPSFPIIPFTQVATGPKEIAAA